MKRFISFIMLAASAAMLTGIVSCKKADEIAYRHCLLQESR